MVLLVNVSMTESFDILFLFLNDGEEFLFVKANDCDGVIDRFRISDALGKDEADHTDAVLTEWRKLCSFFRILYPCSRAPSPVI